MKPGLKSRPTSREPDDNATVKGLLCRVGAGLQSRPTSRALPCGIRQARGNRAYRVEILEQQPRSIP
jgi:hypothetical protein